VSNREVPHAQLVERDQRADLERAKALADTDNPMTDPELISTVGKWWLPEPATAAARRCQAAVDIRRFVEGIAEPAPLPTVLPIEVRRHRGPRGVVNMVNSGERGCSPPKTGVIIK
jgi:hypothetical protein